MNTREIKKLIRKFHIDDNAILLVKEGSAIAEHKELLGRAIDQAGIKNVILVMVEDMNDVKVFSKLDMNRLGWHRKEEITRLLTSKSVKAQEVKGEKVESS